jgi:hypothetical protein
MSAFAATFAGVLLGGTNIGAFSMNQREMGKMRVTLKVKAAEAEVGAVEEEVQSNQV